MKQLLLPTPHQNKKVTITIQKVYILVRRSVRKPLLGKHGTRWYFQGPFSSETSESLILWMGWALWFPGSSPSLSTRLGVRLSPHFLNSENTSCSPTGAWPQTKFGGWKWDHERLCLGTNHSKPEQYDTLSMNVRWFFFSLKLQAFSSKFPFYPQAH